MINQLKVEQYKMWRFLPFYLCILFSLLIFAGALIHGYSPEFLRITGYTRMSDGFIEGVQDCSYAFLWGLMVSWYVGIDFTGRTIHRAVVTGNSRWSIILSRYLSVSVLVLLFHVIVILQTILSFGKQFGVSFEGFRPEYLLWFGVVCLQILAFTAFFSMISFLMANVYLALFTAVPIALLGGNILRNFLGGNYIYEHSFFCLAKSCEISDLAPCAICAIIAIVVFLVATIVIVNRKDIQ